MARSFPPIWKEFAFRRYGLGDKVEPLLRKYPPLEVEKFGPWCVYRYYPGGKGGIHFSGLSFVTKDNRLIMSQAWDCTWQYRFLEDTSETTALAQWEAKRMEKAASFVAVVTPLVSHDRRFEAVWIEDQSLKPGDVRVDGWIAKEDDLAELKRLVESNRPPFDVQWWVKVQPNFHTNKSYKLWKRTSVDRRNSPKP
jgi:hypothetical protein